MIRRFPCTLSHRRRLALIGIVALLLTAVLYLWLLRLGPFGHEPPDGYPAIDLQNDYTVFVYGTLRYSWVRWLVMGTSANPRPAILRGYRKQGLDLVEEPRGETKGLVFTVTGQQLRRLDRYERLGIRYQRMQYTLADGTRAWAYSRLPDSARASKQQRGLNGHRPVHAGMAPALSAVVDNILADNVLADNILDDKKYCYGGERAVI